MYVCPPALSFSTPMMNFEYLIQGTEVIVDLGTSFEGNSMTVFTSCTVQVGKDMQFTSSKQFQVLQQAHIGPLYLVLLGLATRCEALNNGATAGVAVAVVMSPVIFVCMCLVCTCLCIVIMCKQNFDTTNSHFVGHGWLGDYTHTAGGQSVNNFHPTVPPPSGVMTQQVDTQLPQAGLHEGEAPPRYEEAITMEGHY